MHFLVSLIGSLILCFIADDFMRKKNKYLYVLTSAVAIADLFYRLNYAGTIELPPVVKDVEKAIGMGALSGAMFVLVMYAGALDVKKSYTRKLLGVRAELSIMASIFFMAHTIPNCIAFFKSLKIINFSSPALVIYFLLAVSAILCFIIVLPLWITSYRNVRKKMSAKGWKSLQRLAYLVYALIYIHVSIRFLFSVKPPDYFKFGVYTAAFVPYLILKLKKEAARKKRVPQK